MPASEADLMARLDALGIETATHRHTPVFTVAESRDLRGVLPGGHAKSLLLKTKKGAYVLAIVEETRTVDLKALGATLGLPRLSFARPERLMALLGVEPGSVTPFAVINLPPVEGRPPFVLILDRAMMQKTPLNFHPLHNAATTAITPEELIQFIEDCEVTPRILDFDKLDENPTN